MQWLAWRLQKHHYASGKYILSDNVDILLWFQPEEYKAKVEGIEVVEVSERDTSNIPTQRRGTVGYPHLQAREDVKFIVTHIQARQIAENKNLMTDD